MVLGKKTSFRIIMLLIVTVLSLYLTACNGKVEPGVSADVNGSDSTVDDAADETADETQHKDLLRLPVMTSFIASDPHYTVQNADYGLYTVLYESFYDVDSEQNTEPRLATDYEISEDNLVYTYHLRSGVKWQTGGDFTSSDVVYSIKRAQESPYTAGYVAMIADVKAIDDLTVQITLAGVSPTFFIDINRVMMLSEEATKDLPQGFTDQISGGTGPYKMITWGPDQKTVITRNDEYYGDLAPIGTIEFHVFADSSASMRAFEAGELDWISVPTADWSRISADESYKTFLQDTISVIFITMNTEVAPFDDVRVRQAFNYALNKEDMLYSTVEDMGSVVSSLANPTFVFGAPDAGEIFEYSYDPEKAKELLAEAGYADGLTIEQPLLAIGSDEFTVPAQVFQQQLAEVGISVEIETMEQSAYIEDIISGNYALGVMGLSLDIDASMLSLAYITDGINALNLARYSNEDVDRLCQEAASTLDQDKRKAYFTEAFDIASREAAYVPMYSIQVGIASGLDLNSSVYVSYYKWYWDEQ